MGISLDILVLVHVQHQYKYTISRRTYIISKRAFVKLQRRTKNRNHCNCYWWVCFRWNVLCMDCIEYIRLCLYTERKKDHLVINSSYDRFISADGSTVINNRLYRLFLMITKHEWNGENCWYAYKWELIITFKTNEISHLWHAFVPPSTIRIMFVKIHASCMHILRTWHTHIIIFMESAGMYACLLLAYIICACWPLNENHFTVAEWTSIELHHIRRCSVFWTMSYDAFMYTFRKLSGFITRYYKLEITH